MNYHHCWTKPCIIFDLFDVIWKYQLLFTLCENLSNFCGLGAIDETQRGNIFPTEQIGIRAHVQHLQAYGMTTPLKQELVDPRYKWVNPKGKAPTVFELAGTWAADRSYGDKLFGLLQQLANY